MKKALKLLMVMCVAVMMVALVGCGSSDKTEDLGPGSAKDGNEVSVESAAFKLLATSQEGGYQLVDTEGMKALVDAKEDMIIIDTMPADSYAGARIPGAVNAEIALTKDEITAEQRAAFVEALGTDKSKKIVVYCGFVGCPRSHLGAMIAKEEGFTNIVRYPGGIVAWQDAGYDVESDK